MTRASIASSPLSVFARFFQWEAAGSVVLLFLTGAALMVVFSTVTSLIQLIAPNEMRGRVMSIYNIAFRGGMPLGSLAAGALIPSFGPANVVGLQGVVLGALALYMLLVHRKLAAL